MSGGLAKACVPRKKYSVPEKIEFLIVRDLLFYCNKFKSFMGFYEMQIKAHNATAHHIF